MIEIVLNLHNMMAKNRAYIDGHGLLVIVDDQKDPSSKITLAKEPLMLIGSSHGQTAPQRTTDPGPGPLQATA